MKKILRYYCFIVRGGPIVRPRFLIAHSSLDALQKLFALGHSPLWLKPVPDFFIVFLCMILRWFRIGLSQNTYRRWWLKEMADLLGSGLSLSAAVESTLHQTNHLMYKIILYQIYYDLLAGSSFADATQRNRLFTPLQNIAIQSAEKNHHLREALMGLYDYLSDQLSYRSKQSIFVFPCILMIVMTMFLSHYIATNILQIYMYDLWLQGKELSFVPSLFMKIYSGSFVRTMATILLIYFSMRIFFYLLSFIQYGPFRQIMDRFMLYLPFKKKVIRRRETLHFLSSLVFSLKSGIRIHSAVFQSAFVVRHVLFHQEIIQVYHKIFAGYSIDVAFQSLSFIEMSDKITLISCLSHYGVDKSSIDKLTDYIYLRLKNMELMAVKLTNMFWGFSLLCLILFLVSSTFSIIAFSYV